MESKLCPKCGCTKDISLFFLRHQKPDCWCKDCCSLASKTYYHANKDKRVAYTNLPTSKAAKAISEKKYREKNSEALAAKKAEYYIKNIERIKKKYAENYANNPESAKHRKSLWVDNNRAKHNANCMNRHTRKMGATPAWLDDDQKWMIQQAYELAQERTQLMGIKWHVDHIVPLQAKTACGLHVPWNLQVITASENCSKRNRMYCA